MMKPSRRLASTTAGGGSSMAELVPRNFLQPCLLLLLREQPDHGYELASRLRPMHDGDGDAGGVYRALRGLERHGLVRSEWETSDVGPARRTYHITADGLQCLATQVGDLRHVDEVLHVFLDRYTRVVSADRRNGAEEVTDDRRTEGAARADATVDRIDGAARRHGVRPAQRAVGRAGH